MKSVKKHSFHILISLLSLCLLTVCLLTGCMAPDTARSSSEVQTYDQTQSPEESQDSLQEQPGPDSQEAKKTQADFDQMTDQLFLEEVSQSLITLHFTLADPAAFGITDYDRTLGSLSLDENKKVIAEARSLLQQLNTIDKRLLTKEQRLTYTILFSYVNTLLSCEDMELYDQPLSSSLGVQAQLPILLSEYAFYSRRDVEDYLALLTSIDTYYESLIAYENQQADAGLGLSDTVLDRIIRSCSAYLLDADHSFMAETFKERLEPLEDLTPQEKEDYIAKNNAAIDGHFVPAYEKLIEGLEGLKGRGKNEMGLCGLPLGKEYYQYLVNSGTGTSYSDIPSLKKAMIDQMLADLRAMDELLAANPDLSEKLYSYSFSLTDPEAILEDLRNQCSEDFPSIGSYNCRIKNVPQALEQVLSPAFYLTVPIDRPEDNSIYINQGSTNAGRSLYTTLAHEGYPGHMYQNLYFNQKNSCNLRKLLSFSSYTEGWATYVEYYSYGLNNGLGSELGELLKHNSSFTLALYAILDINIHYEGWNMKQVSDYLNHYFSISDASVVNTIYYDIVENPSNYLEYYVGYLEILNMEKEARKALGEKYSQLEFNRFLLDIGPAPFSVIKPYFNQWLLEQK